MPDQRRRGLAQAPAPLLLLLLLLPLLFLVAPTRASLHDLDTQLDDNSFTRDATPSRFPASRRTGRTGGGGGGGGDGPRPSTLYFENLSEDELSEHYSMPPVSSSPAGGLSGHPPPALSQLAQLVAPWRSQYLVDVMLVGFAGDGEAAVTVGGQELARYLQAAGVARDQVRHTIQALEGREDGATGDDSGHDLPFKTKFLYRVQQAHPSLRRRVQFALQDAVDETIERNPHIVRAARGASANGAGGSQLLAAVEPTVPVSVGVVDEVIEADWVDTASGPTIYILNLAPVTLRDEPKSASHSGTAQAAGGGSSPELTRLRYVYTQHCNTSFTRAASAAAAGADTQAADGNGAPDAATAAAAAAAGCPTTHWLSPVHRYLWFDLTAGPISYGPLTWGDGLVSEWSLPNTRRMLAAQHKYEKRAWQLQAAPLVGGVQMPEQRKPFEPSSTLNAHFHHQLLSELALLLSKVMRGVLQPPANHWPVPYADTLKIVLTFVHERHSATAAGEGAATIESQPPSAAEVPATDDAKRPKASSSPFAKSVSAVRDMLKRTHGMHISSSRHSNKKALGSDKAVEERAAWGLFPDGSAAPSPAAGEDEEATVGGAETDGWSEWLAVESALLDLALPRQTIEIENQHLRFEECEQCVLALTHARRAAAAHAAELLQDEPPSSAAASSPSTAAADAALHASAHSSSSSSAQSIDSAELKDWLEHFDASIAIGRDADSNPRNAAPEKEEEERRRMAQVREALKNMGTLNSAEREKAQAQLSVLYAQNGPRSTGSSLSSGAPGSNTRVLRVFIFDLASTEVVLLDRFHQAVAYPEDGMVLAVQSRAAKAPVDFSCDGRAVALNPRDAARATLGALLTAGWGVAPSFQRWTPALRDTEHDWLFSLGHTPYGPFSQSKTLHFGLKDAAIRHVLISELHASMRDLQELLPRLQPPNPAAAVAGIAASAGSVSSDHLAAPPALSGARSASGPPAALLDSLVYSSPSLDFVRRWNVLMYQQSRAAHWINLHHLSQAWLYIQAAAHDLRQLTEMVQEEIEGHFDVSLQCGTNAPGQADTVAGLPLASARSSAGGSASSASALLSTPAHWVFFATLEGIVLVCLVGAVWFASSYPHLAARIVPTPLARALGLGAFKPKQY